MNVVQDILARNRLKSPDGRALHFYRVVDDEFERLSSLLKPRLATGEALLSTGQGFAIYASEFIRRKYEGGPLSWLPIFRSVGLNGNDQSLQALARELTGKGLEAWERTLRQGESGMNLYIYTLMAEGGLPDALIREATHYKNMLIGLVREVEAEGPLGGHAAETICSRHLLTLPQTFRTEDTRRLLADLALTLVKARSLLQKAFPAEDIVTEDVVVWLNDHHPDWSRELPLRLSDETLKSLIRPVLTAERSRQERHKSAVTRSLRRADDGDGWVGLASISDGGFIPALLFSSAGRDQRLRLSTDAGAGFLAVPENDGWRISRSGGRGDAVIPLHPDQAVVLSVHADGRSLGDVTLDPGLPSPEDVPSLWRSSDATKSDPDELVLLSGRARTTAACVWILGSESDDPIPLTENVSVEEASPVRKGGRLWPVRGSGRIRIGSHEIPFSTGQEDEAVPVRMVAYGKTLSKWLVADANAQAYLGLPNILVGEGDDPLQPIKIGPGLKRCPVSRRLCTEILEWVEDGFVLARLRVVVLPEDSRLDVREMDAGRLHLEVCRLTPGWHILLRAGSVETGKIVGDDGAVKLTLETDEVAAGTVSLRLGDPSSGRNLDLSTPWPSNTTQLVTPEDKRLDRNRPLAVARLAGWRALFPDTAGTIQLNIAGKGSTVAFEAGGIARLQSHEDLVRQILSLAGPDARVNLFAVVHGRETPRLELCSHDWSGEEAGPFHHLGVKACLHAVDMKAPDRTREIAAESRIDMESWLGSDDTVWFVQGRSEENGVMRPFVWSPRPRPRSTREDRIARYAECWRACLRDFDNPVWEQFWRLVGGARQNGDASALDQVSALGDVPAATVALLFRRPRTETTSVLDIETEAPIWWPIVPCTAWKEGLKHAKDHMAERLKASDMDEAEAAQLIASRLAGHAGAILALRPELLSHIGQAMSDMRFPPVATNANDDEFPLSIPKPLEHLKKEADEVVRRVDRLPHGVGGVRARNSPFAGKFSDKIRPLIDAPIVAAEIAAGIEPTPSAAEILKLLSLRAVDPVWFDRALPAALILALETS